MIRSATGIVLRRSTDRESDTSARVLLETGELLNVRMHGIRSSRQRSSLISEPGALVQITFYVKESGGISLKEGNVIRRFDEIKQDYAGTIVLSAILEATAEAAKGGAVPELYQLLLGALQRFETLRKPSTTPPDPTVGVWLLVFFRVKLLDLLGLLGASCSSCGGPVTKDVEWLLPEAAFLCSNCARSAIAFDGWAWRVIADAVDARFNDFHARRVGEAGALDLERRLAASLSHYFGSALVVAEAVQSHFKGGAEM